MPDKPEETPDELVDRIRPDLEDIFDFVQGRIPEGWYFALTVFPPSPGSEGRTAGAYLTNCSCNHCLHTALDAWASRIQKLERH